MPTSIVCTGSESVHAASRPNTSAHRSHQACSRRTPQRRVWPQTSVETVVAVLGPDLAWLYGADTLARPPKAPPASIRAGLSLGLKPWSGHLQGQRPSLPVITTLV